VASEERREVSSDKGAKILLTDDERRHDADSDLVGVVGVVGVSMGARLPCGETAVLEDSSTSGTEWIVGRMDEVFSDKVSSTFDRSASRLTSKCRLEVGSLVHGGGIDRDRLIEDIQTSFSR
jgi:hypothetical protein